MKNTLLLGTAWTASAFAAVGFGFLAVSLVDASASPGTVPAAATDTSAGASAEVTPSPAGTSPNASGEQATVGGTAYASCAGGTPDLAGAPAPGWWVDDSDDPGEVEFKNGTQKVEVHVTCAGGSPRFSVEGPRADDSGGDDDRPATTPSAGRTGGSYSPSTSPSADRSDDSDGRDGGGHGSDDGPGDDSGHGGSGSDDSGSDDSGHGGSGSDDSGSDSGSDSGKDDSDGRDGGGHGSDD